MKLKFFFITILIVMLVIPLIDTQIFSIAFAQSSDKSFKGAAAPFIPPPESERTPKVPPTDGISLNDLPHLGINDTEKEDGGEEKDKDKFPPLTQGEIKELPFDNFSDYALLESKIISSNTSSTDPLMSIVEEIIKNDSRILDDDNINSFNSSKIKNKYDNTKLEQIFIVQNMSQGLDTNIGTNETKLISNTTRDQQHEYDNIISSLELPSRDILNFINNTKVDFTVTEAAEEEEQQQPAVTDELTTEGVKNITNTETQSKAHDLEDEGKTITIEELPMRSEESQNEGVTEGNVTIKGPKINNTSDNSDLTTSTELTDQYEQET